MTEEVMEEAVSAEYNFIGILNRLQHLDYWEKNDLMSIERQLYEELTRTSDNTIGLTALLRNQIMQGNIAKSKALAHKIWSIGGEIPQIVEYAYLDSLLDLGMLDMAMVLLKPRLSDISDIGIFAPAAAKFAIMTGNFNLIEKLAASPETSYFGSLSDFIGVYKTMQYGEHFKNMQKIILENCKNKMAAFDYNVYFDRGITDLEAVVYISGSKEDCKNMQAEIEKKINGYFASAGVQRLNNYCLRLYPVTEHEAKIK